jgi:hypothetical protein
VLAFERGLEAKVEVAEGLRGRKPGGAHGGHEPPGIAERDLGRRSFEGGDGAELAVPDSAEDAVEGFERAGHLEIGQLGPEPVADGRRWRSSGASGELGVRGERPLLDGDPRDGADAVRGARRVGHQDQGAIRPARGWSAACSSRSKRTTGCSLMVAWRRTVATAASQCRVWALRSASPAKSRP